MHRGKVRTIVVTLLAAVLVLAGVSAPARAQENPPAAPQAQKKTPIPEPLAVETAKKECFGFTLDPALWAAAIPTLGQSVLGTQRVCEDGVKASLVSGDRQMGARAACESGAGPVLDSVSVKEEKKQEYFKGCAEKLGPILLRAWEVVQPAAAAKGEAATKAAGAVEQATCVVSAGGWPCLMKQVTTWMTNESGQFSLSVSEVLTAPSAATSILRTFETPSAKRTGQQNAFADVYQVVGSVAVSIALIAALLSLVTALVQRSGRPLGEAFGGIATWGIFWVAGLSLGAMVLAACDSLAAGLVGAHPGGKSEVDKSLDTIFMVLVAAANPATGGLLALIALVLYIVALVGMVVQIVLRDVSILLVAVMIPVLLALRAGPGISRKLLIRSIGTFLMLAAAKPLLILVLRMSSALILTPGTGVRGMFFGLAILVLAAVAPGMAYKLMGVMAGSGAGQSAGAGAAGVADQAMHAAQSLKNMVGGGSPKVGSAAAGGGKAAGAGASKLGAAAGPVGMAATAAVMAGSAMKSGAQALASQVGTGGGALGDAETPRIPTAPVSRGGGGGGGPAAGGSAPKVPPKGQKGGPAPKPGGGANGPGGGNASNQGGPRPQPLREASSGENGTGSQQGLGSTDSPDLASAGPAPRERRPSTPASRAAVRERKAEVRQERVDHKRTRIQQRRTDGRTRR